ncbi:MAG: hypothetical protein CFE34_10060 [Rhodobacteraceae bacterium PARR1]|nr:MAG: hypothetical protein CFE34_10060 [Rhodobacteraceae bacterium PARR1]
MPRFLLLSTAILTLAGCVGGGVRTTVSAAQEVPGDDAGAACHAAVASAVGRSGNDVLIYDRRAAGDGVEVRATAAGENGPWRCLVGADGTVTSVAPL